MVVETVVPLLFKALAHSLPMSVVHAHKPRLLFRVYPIKITAGRPPGLIRIF